MAAWEWDVESGLMTWSNDPEVMLGFPLGAFGPAKRLLNAIHADDRERIAAALDTALVTGTYEGEYRIVRPNGSVAWVTERGRAIGPDSGVVEKSASGCWRASERRATRPSGSRSSNFAEITSPTLKGRPTIAGRRTVGRPSAQ